MKHNGYTNSQDELIRAKELIPGGIKGMHKINNIKNFPIYFSSGEQCYLYDIDGNRYIDYILAKGPYVLGYRNKEVEKSVIEQVIKGNVFPSGNTLHNKVAKQLMELIPCAEKVLFYKTGSCATTSAVRLARTYTQKSIVLSSGYHGWHDWCSEGEGLSTSKESFFDFNYNLNLLDSLVKKFKNRIAAVIVTPEEYYFETDLYKYIQYICQAENIVFILDEVKSGFRVDVGGFQSKYSVTPDLATFSKAMSNGYSIAALVGKEEILDINESIHTTGTYDLETVPFAAANKTIKIIRDMDIPNKIRRSGEQLCNCMDEIFNKYNLPIYSVFATGSFRFWCDNWKLEEEFYQQMAMEGVLFYTYDNSYICASHTNETIAKTLDAVERVSKTLSGKHKRAFGTFSQEKIFLYPNKKGFLNNYPGVNGRGIKI